MNDNLEDLKVMINVLELDLVKFYTKGNKAASVRARKTLQNIRAQALKMRGEISQARK